MQPPIRAALNSICKQYLRTLARPGCCHRRLRAMASSAMSSRRRLCYAGRVSTATKFPARMTIAEFLDWCPEDGRTWQLVDGEPIATAPASTSHARMLAEIARVLANHLLERGSPCTVLVEPGVKPHLAQAHNVRISDLAVSCSAAGDDGRLSSEPVLVIKILSPSNHQETWANVWAYASIPSVREILVVSSVEVSADLLARRADGSWPEGPTRLSGSDITLETIGFRSARSAFYRTARLSGAPASSA